MATATDEIKSKLLSKAGLSPPPLIQPLSPPPDGGLRPPLPLETAEAKSLLAEARADIKTSERSIIRKFFSTRTGSKRPETNQIFTVAEVARVIDRLLHELSLRPVGVAQAVWLHARDASLHDLWYACHDAAQKSSKQGVEGGTDTEPWLNRLTRLQALEYVALLCEMDAKAERRVERRVETLNSAFRIAFNRRDLEAMELLLSYGADASSCKDDMPERIQHADHATIALFLAAPRDMSDESWRHVLGSCSHVGPATWSLCVSHRPSIADKRILDKALKSRDLAWTAILLAHMTLDVLARCGLSACKVVCGMTKPTRRYEFLSLFRHVGLLSDSPVLREELTKDVKDGQLPLVRMLIKAGVRPESDIESQNALRAAVIKMDLEMVDALHLGALRNAKAALDWIPTTATEEKILRLLESLTGLDLAGDPLNRRLIRAVQCRNTSEVKELIARGASVDYQKAAALHAAICNGDFIVFGLLIMCDCSLATLASILPALVRLPRQERLPIITKVLSRGPSPQSLGLPLELLISQPGEADVDCIRLLLDSRASPDVSDDDSTNSVLVATRKGQFRVLKMLCAASIRAETLSRAIVIAFNGLSTGALDDDVAFETMRLLLGKGASGVPLNQSLLSAVTQKAALRFIELLLSYGADANHAGGEAYIVALSNQHMDAFKLLCARCQPDEQNTQRLIPLAIDQKYYEPSALDSIFSHTSDKEAALATVTPELLRNNPNMAAILQYLLPRGLNLNSGDCTYLRLAVNAQDFGLLRHMLAADPNVRSLQLAFEASTQLRVRETRFGFMKLILERAAGSEIGQTACLKDQTQLAIDGDFEGLQIVLRYGAMVDHQAGVAVQMASVGGHLEVLGLLLKNRPAIETIKQACLVSLESFASSTNIQPNHKSAVFEALLDSNPQMRSNVSHVSDLLNHSVQQLPTETRFPALLLERGAQLAPESFQAALERASDDLVHLLLPTRLIKGRQLFLLAYKNKMPVDRRLWLLSELLKQNVRPLDKSRALLRSLKPDRIDDLAAARLLIKHGADVSFDNGEAFKLSVQAQSADAVELLSEHISTAKAANDAFSHASKIPIADARTRARIYECLLASNLVDESKCSAALRTCFDGRDTDLDTIRLLLKAGAEPNASCLVSACRVNSSEQFKELCKYTTLDLVVEALISHFERDSDAAKWLNLCMVQQSRSAKITKVDTLLKCMQKYRSGDSVLSLILQRINCLTPTVSHSICPGWPRESCSFLIWVLLTVPNLSRETFRQLCFAGLVDIDYETPTTRLSAPLLCLLDSSRISVLEDLIQLRPDLVDEHDVSVSALARLGAFPKVATQEDIDQLQEPTFRMAPLYLGNLDAFKVLNKGYPMEDSMLHTAAFLALPKFVKEFLSSHDPNEIHHRFKHYTPLAVAIETPSGPPWCKVADLEAPFEERRRETIRLLAHASDFTWRFRQMTYVHLALHADAGTTKVLLDALDIAADPNRFQKLAYTDKAHRTYTPYEYVKEFVKVPALKEKELLECLEEAHLLTVYQIAAFHS